MKQPSAKYFERLAEAAWHGDEKAEARLRHEFMKYAIDETGLVQQRTAIVEEKHNPLFPIPTAVEFKSLLDASRDGNTEAASQLLDTFGDNILEKTDPNRCTPLIIAAMSNQAGSVALLIERGANIEARNQNESTPLIVAALLDAPESLRVLLKNGADVGAENQSGSTALMFAKQFDKVECIQILQPAQDAYDKAKQARLLHEDLATLHKGTTAALHVGKSLKLRPVR